MLKLFADKKVLGADKPLNKRFPHQLVNTLQKSVEKIFCILSHVMTCPNRSVSTNSHCYRTHVTWSPQKTCFELFITYDRLHPPPPSTQNPPLLSCFEGLSPRSPVLPPLWPGPHCHSKVTAPKVRALRSHCCSSGSFCRTCSCSTYLPPPAGSTAWTTCTWRRVIEVSLVQMGGRMREEEEKEED